VRSSLAGCREAKQPMRWDRCGSFEL